MDYYYGSVYISDRYTWYYMNVAYPKLSLIVTFIGITENVCSKS
jgi:hypothetical protein